MPDTLIEGIDVSSNQGEVDWRTVARAGKAFGFARATIGGHQCDPQFVANWQRMSDAGIIRGAYHFFWPLTPWQDQAENFIKTVGALNPGDLPPVLDLEEAIPKSSASKRDAWEDVPADQRPSIIRNWLDAVEQALSMRPMIIPARILSSLCSAMKSRHWPPRDCGLRTTRWPSHPLRQAGPHEHSGSIRRPAVSTEYTGMLIATDSVVNSTICKTSRRVDASARSTSRLTPGMPEA